MHHEEGWTFPREIAEAVEAVEAVPLPARYGFWAVSGGVAVEVVTREDTIRLRHLLERRLQEQGVPVRKLRLVEDRGYLQHPIPLRGDLQEQTFNVPRGENMSTIETNSLTYQTEEAVTQGE